MTGDLIPFKPSRGRPSKVHLAIVQEQADDARDDLTAYVAEAIERQARFLAIVRRAERNLARGWSAASDLDELERETVRWGDQLAAATAEMAPVCPDGETRRHVGCGRAA